MLSDLVCGLLALSIGAILGVQGRIYAVKSLLWTLSLGAILGV